jgi:hypothetical protein
VLVNGGEDGLAPMATETQAGAARFAGGKGRAGGFKAI